LNSRCVLKSGPGIKIKIKPDWEWANGQRQTFSNCHVAGRCVLLLHFIHKRMAEDLQIAAGTKEEQYEALIPQIKGLLEGEEDLVANLGNVAAALKEQFGWFWVGFYLVKGSELVLGPFQGPVACTRIRRGRGVCGAAWQQAQTLNVPDVEKFPGHIACSSLSRSEIVIPIFKQNDVVAVLDVDSVDLNTFDDTDQRYLEAIVRLVKF
jgi:L-methionine (R)-S-oxide reductase